MIANALLVRWHGGWRERTRESSITARGRREALLGLGAAQSTTEVDRIADGQLDVFARDRTVVAADIDPATEEDTPYVGYRLGDTLTLPGRFNVGTEQQRITSITVSEDDEGNLTYAAEFGDKVLDDRQRFELAIKKMSDGTLAGQSKAATPASQVASIPIDCCPPPPPIISS